MADKPTFKQDLFVNGEFVPATTGKRFNVINPANEETIAQVAEANEQDVDRAVQSANAALNGAWGKMSATDRSKILLKLADLFESQLDAFSVAESMHNGKTLGEARYGEMPMCVEVLRYYAGIANKIEGATLPANPAMFAYTLKEPVGVVAIITPWNFPLLLAMWKIAPALAAGCTVVHKPASLTPLTALMFAELCAKAGLPAGVYNVVTGPGSTAGAALVKHPLVDKISFTGETSTGKWIMKTAADGIKRITLELGGKSPNIVFEDADLEAASRGSFNAIFYNKGEVCCAGSRLLVHESVHKTLLDKLVDRVNKTTLGDPLDKNTRMGPLVSKEQQEKVAQYVEIGKKDGAKVVAGGSKPANLSRGFYYLPTILDDAPMESKVVTEEIFGPVLSVIKFKDVNDAIQKANNTIYGLAAGIWTKDITKAHTVARAIKAGTVWINCYNFYDITAPFGGYKQSGFGRELGFDAVNMYLESKTVIVGLR